MEAGQLFYKICPKCPNFCSTREPDRYCAFCGSELIDACPSCQKPINLPNAKYCKYCGKPYPGRDKTDDIGPLKF